jgi:hypothetical protein
LRTILNKYCLIPNGKIKSRKNGRRIIAAKRKKRGEKGKVHGGL